MANTVDTSKFMTCRGTCGRTLRPTSVKLADAPDTVAYKLNGYCARCLNAQNTTTKRTQMPERCVGGCYRKLRRQNESIEDYPGSVIHRGRGMCASCYTKKTAGASMKPRRPVPTYCLGPCGRELRKGHQTIKDRPGTVKHQGRGYCQSCYEKCRAIEDTNDAEAAAIRRARDAERKRQARAEARALGLGEDVAPTPPAPRERERAEHYKPAPVISPEDDPVAAQHAADLKAWTEGRHRRRREQQLRRLQLDQQAAHRRLIAARSKGSRS